MHKRMAIFSSEMQRVEDEYNGVWEILDTFGLIKNISRDCLDKATLPEDTKILEYNSKKQYEYAVLIFPTDDPILTSYCFRLEILYNRLLYINDLYFDLKNHLGVKHEDFCFDCNTSAL